MPVDQEALIVRGPNVCHGQAVVKSTRVMVSVALDALAGGMSETEIMAECPTLTVEGIRAAAAYGAELARDEYPAVSALEGPIRFGFRCRSDRSLPEGPSSGLRLPARGPHKSPLALRPITLRRLQHRA
jgi:uncharacterized protein (DUF433 family)